jgi:carbonic anhydrase
MYYYKGTITTPPCTKEVDYVLMKNAIKIRSDDFNALRKNVFAYRAGTTNINKYL